MHFIDCSKKWLINNNVHCDAQNTWGNELCIFVKSSFFDLKKKNLKYVKIQSDIRALSILGKNI